jgi:purine-binding chemotaxis protein CheW
MTDVSYVTLSLDDQLCGLPVLAVRDVLAGQKIAQIPLAPPEVAGNLNLRGRIVTAIDLRRRLGLSARAPGTESVCVVTEHGTELYALIVDRVHEVVSLPGASLEPNPPTLPAVWAAQCCGIHRVGGRLMAVLDVDVLLHLDRGAAA